MDPPVPPWFRDLSFRVNLLPRKMAHAIPGRGTPRASTVVVNRVSILFRANSFQPIFRIRFSENRSIFNSNRIMIIIIITPIKSTLPSSDYYQSDFLFFSFPFLLLLLLLFFFPPLFARNVSKWTESKFEKFKRISRMAARRLYSSWLLSK